MPQRRKRISHRWSWCCERSSFLVNKGTAMPKTHTAVSALESHLGYWLRYVSNQVSHAFAPKVQARGVTVAEWVVLRERYDKEVRPSALAERLGMTRGAISKLAG